MKRKVGAKAYGGSEGEGEAHEDLALMVLEVTETISKAHCEREVEMLWTRLHITYGGPTFYLFF